MIPLPPPLWGDASEPEDEPEPLAQRFWNQRLKPLYDACPLPVQSTPSAPHHRAEPSYGFRFTFQDWHQNWTHVPPSGPPTDPSLAARLRPLVHPSPPPEPKAPPRKKAKAAASDSPSTSTTDDVDAALAEPKKQPPFKRKIAVEGHLRAYKIRMWPTREQERELVRAFAGARKAYNWALEQVKEHGQRPNAIALRGKFRAEYEPPDWLKDDKGKHAISSHILAGGVRQLADAYASNKAKRDKDPSHHYEIKYRGRRNYTDTIKIDKNPQTGTRISPLLRFQPVPYANSEQRAECLAFLGSNFKGKGGIRLQDKQHVIARLLAEGDRLKEDAKIQHDKRTNAYYFIYTFEAPKLADPDPEFTSKRIASLDSGVEPFNAYYSPTTGEYGQLLRGFRDQLEPRVLKLDALQSKITKRYVWIRDPTTGKITDKQLAPPPSNRTRTQWRRTTHRLEKQLARERRRHVGWTQAAHYNAANFLLAKFDLVVNPKLQTQRLSMRRGRKLRTKTARAMLTMSHYMFDQRLQWASTRYAGRHVIDSTGEPGTSKTCGNCGAWKPDLTLGDKVFCCDKCGVRIHRDTANGARNNFFAALGKAMGVGPDRTRA